MGRSRGGLVSALLALAAPMPISFWKKPRSSKRPSQLPGKGFHILPLSAKTKEALNAASENLLKFLIENPDSNLQEVAWTLQAGRKEI